ncbi:MAG: EFR1 family ferrodoxin [Prevotella sp.]|nr:EFR1 family ferrodoxin [Prevotella sp.]MDY3271189.1 EFR1 family ferrodoxin [Prevotella sp.]
MIFYFSCTGNTRWAARQIADATDDELVFIPDLEDSAYTPSLQDGERIGFCFPVHGWQPPRIVRQFIRRLNIVDAERHYTYALITAGDTISETARILRKELAAVGLPLHATCSLLMPESYVGLPFMDVDNKENEKRKIEEAQKKLEWFIQQVKACNKGIEDLDIGRWPRINSRIIGNFFHRYLVTDRPFHVDTERCLRCGLCANACPVKNIVGGKGQTPQWNHDGTCLSCFACYHHCPTHAIEYGSRTKNKGQYYFKKEQ